MDREEAIYTLKNTAWLGTNEDREKTEQAVEMAIEVLSAEPTDLISKEDAIAIAYRQCDGFMTIEQGELLEGFEEEIKAFPSADRPSGEWIIRDDMPKLDNTYSIECSKCGQLMFGHYNADNPNYCPNCGADMRGKPHDD